jgi:AraC-like DNA-binding protein
MLARYSDPHGRLREILTRPGFGGSVLVIDRDAATRGDHRLVAHLAADEPSVNAALACSDYLSQARHSSCRPLAVKDLWVTPFAEDRRHDTDVDCNDGMPIDRHGRSYRLLPFAEGNAIPELRWQRSSPTVRHGDPQPICLREVIAALESYQPMRELTVRALSDHRHGKRLSLSTLRGELERMNLSPIVLNRGLREAVQRAIAQGDSVSEIAIRCGRLKYDARGNIYGDTSWLARRVGLLPTAGKSNPTPWVHSDVLALIARRGLAISPREVELG